MINEFFYDKMNSFINKIMNVTFSVTKNDECLVTYSVEVKHCLIIKV